MERKRKKHNKAPIKAQKAFGPKVADIFVGDSTGEVASIIRIPRSRHVNIERQQDLHRSRNGARLLRSVIGAGLSGKALDELTVPFDTERLTYDNDIVFHFPGSADIPEPIEEKLVREELSRFLDEDLKREEDFQVKVTDYKKHPQIINDEPVIIEQEVVKEQTVVQEKVAPVVWHREQRISQRFVKEMRELKKKKPDKISALKTENEKVDDGSDDLLKSIMQKSETEGYIPWVAPPVAWKKFRKEKKPTTPVKREIVKATVAEKPEKKKREKVPRKVDKKNILESSRVAFAVFLIGGAVGLIGAVNGLPNVAKAVGAVAKQGAQHLTLGLKAIAGSDVDAGKEELDQATKLFTDAQEQLDSSTNIALRLLAKLDPKARLDSGENLLLAGKQLSALGDDAAQLVQLFRQPKTDNQSLTDLLEKSQPLVKSLAEQLNKIDGEIKDINPSVLPSEIQGDLLQLQKSVHLLAQVIESYLDSHEVLNMLLGAKQDRQYLFLFENNRELRPGGGFIGSFALANLSKGGVKKVKVDTIYNPDGQLRDFIIPPTPLKKITDRWFSRDGNWFADFRTNAQKVATLFEKSGGPTVDGVIAITPSVLQQMLRVTGPIPMPDYNLTIDANNVIDETQRLVTYDYDKEENNPKAFISDLMPEVMSRVTKLPQDRWGDLASVFGDSLKQKQLLIWFRDIDAQTRIEKLGWGGKIEDAKSDYLMRVEANIGGHKTDELMDQSVKYDVSFNDTGEAMATLITTRHHKGSINGRPGWNPDEDWFQKNNVIYERTLVPKGSVLLEAVGFTKTADVPTPYVNKADYKTFVQDADVAELEKDSTTVINGTVVSEESGKTSFGNWIVTKPGETTVTIYKYRLPATQNLSINKNGLLNYQLLSQQQPGHQPLKFEASVHVSQDFHFVWAGPESGITYNGEQNVSFTTIQKSDNVWGVVIDKI
ncbi:MAG: DUF4012 domain-containing protein [bacterium]|nr:DUF4012 domain-containing protein [bacterium]